MNKHTLIGLCLSLCILTFAGCAENDTDETLTEIKIGNENLSKLTIEKQMMKKIILSGGNGKYRVNVENSQIASATINEDTLFVTGHNIGETYATIMSHDFKKKLDISVIIPGISVSSQSINLKPGEENTQEISVSGGGNVKLSVYPEGVVDYKLNAKGYLELYPRYEGKAIITITSQDDRESKDIEVNVKPEGETEQYGWYSTRYASYAPLIDNRLTVNRTNEGTWFFNTTRPNAGSTMFIAAVSDLVKGQEVQVNVMKNTYKPKSDANDNIAVGRHTLTVEEIQKDYAILLGKGVKLKLPYTPL